jgi:hypothetical protein
MALYKLNRQAGFADTTAADNDDFVFSEKLERKERSISIRYRGHGAERTEGRERMRRSRRKRLTDDGRTLDPMLAECWSCAMRLNG